MAMCFARGSRAPGRLRRGAISWLFGSLVTNVTGLSLRRARESGARAPGTGGLNVAVCAGFIETWNLDDNYDV